MGYLQLSFCDISGCICWCVSKFAGMAANTIY